MRPVLLLGPTAAGKPKLAIELAKQLNEERQGIPHHLIDIREPDESWTVLDFINKARIAKAEIRNNDKLPIIAGGTGLYLWSLLEGFAFPISPDDKELRAKLEKESGQTLYSQLTTIDPDAAAKIHSNDKKRIIRALEVYELTGKKISELQKIRKDEEPRLSAAGSDPILIGINLPREELYTRINQRVDSMIAIGLIAEVEGLLAKGYPKTLNAFQALGYKEASEFIEGRWTMDEMTIGLKKRTRNFARRQLTWFRRFQAVTWFHPDQKDDIIKLCHAPERKK